MSSLSKIKKNIENFKTQDFYSRMTPEMYQQGIQIATRRVTENLAAQYDEKLQKIQNQANLEIMQAKRDIKNIISVELLYELARQLECFEKEPEFLEQKIEKVKEIYDNTMAAIKKNTEYKLESQAVKNFENKKKQLEKMFKLKF